MTETRDAGGQVIQTWAAVATLWAQIEPLGGRELIEAQGFGSQVSHRIRTRYRAGITPGAHRLVHGARVFNLGAVINAGERDRELELTAIEVIE